MGEEIHTVILIHTIGGGGVHQENAIGGGGGVIRRIQ